MRGPRGERERPGDAGDASVPRVELRGMYKQFGGVRAVDDVSLDCRAGEVVGIVGHNGAGKSTLVRLLAGAERADAGEIRVDGVRATLRSPRDARRFGIETIHQDLALADNLDAVANLFLGREIATRWGTLDERAMESAARAVMARVNPAFSDFGRPVRRLSGGERQSVAIARALQFEARILVMDEPTAALGPQETRAVGGLVERLVAEGLALFVVSHDLHDVLALSHRVAVMKGGRLVGVRRTAEVSHDELLGMILLGDAGHAGR